MKNKVVDKFQSVLSSDSSRPLTLLLCGLATVLSFCLPGSYSLVLVPVAALGLICELPTSRKFAKRVVVPVLAILLLGLATPQKSLALFGFGDIVFDPSSFATLGKIFTSDATLLQKTILTYQQTVKIYENAVQKYTLAKYMSQALSNKNTYSPQALMQIAGSAAQNRYGELAGWNQAMNNGLMIHQAYTTATLPLSSGTSFLSGQPLGSSTHLADLARIGVIDSTSQNSMATVAQISRQQAMNATPVSKWESTVLSNGPDENTEVAQQNLTNMGMVQMYEQQRANLAVNSILAQQVTLQNMKDRNEAVRDLNRWQEVDDYNVNESSAWGRAAAARQNSPW